MHIQNEVKLILLAPCQYAVHYLKSCIYPGILSADGLLLDGEGEQIVVHGQSDAVESHLRHQFHVFPSESVLEPSPVKLSSILFAQYRENLCLDLML